MLRPRQRTSVPSPQVSSMTSPFVTKGYAVATTGSGMGAACDDLRRGRSMKKTSLLVALFALLLSQSAVAASPAQGEVLAVLHEWLDALAKNDLPRIERIMADDYRITVSNGRILDKRED